MNLLRRKAPKPEQNKLVLSDKEIGDLIRQGASFVGVSEDALVSSSGTEDLAGPKPSDHLFISKNEGSVRPCKKGIPRLERVDFVFAPATVQVPCRDPRTGLFPSGFSVFRPSDGRTVTYSTTRQYGTKS